MNSLPVDVHVSFVLAHNQRPLPGLPNILSMDNDRGSILLAILHFHDWGHHRHHHRHGNACLREAKKGNLSWEGDRKNIETQGTTKDSFITQDRNEQIKGVKVEATFSRGHISLI